MHKPTFYLLPIVLIGLLIVFAAAFLVYNQRQVQQIADQPSTDTPSTTKPAIPLLSIEPVLVKTGQVDQLQIWISPKDPNQPLSVIAAKIDIHTASGTVTPLSSSPTLADEFKASNWTFPFAKLDSNPDDGSTSLEMSAVYVAPEPYMLESKQLLVTIPLNLAQAEGDITVTVDPEYSKSFDKQNQELSFISAGQPISVTPAVN